MAFSDFNILERSSQKFKIGPSFHHRMSVQQRKGWTRFLPPEFEKVSQVAVSVYTGCLAASGITYDVSKLFLSPRTEVVSDFLTVLAS